MDIGKSVSVLQKLSQAHKSRFRHRLVTLRGHLKFELRGNLPIAEEMTTLISATAVMMTFGFRNYRLPNLEKFIIYLDTYHSELAQRLRKGEYSSALKTVIFSWEDVLKGFEINNDNINLTLHEFSHVVHLRCHFGSDISSQIYNLGLKRSKNI